MKVEVYISIISMLLLLTGGMLQSSQENNSVEGLIKVPSLINFKDVTVDVLTLNFENVITDQAVKNDGSFTLENLSKQSYILLVEVKDIDKAFLKIVEMKEGKNSVLLDFTNELKEYLAKNMNDLKWMLRSIKHHPLKDDMRIVDTSSGRKDFSFYRDKFPFSADVSYVTWYAHDQKFYETPANAYASYRTDVIVRGATNKGVDWFVTGFISSNSSNLINTTGGVTYSKVEGHRFKALMRYSEHNVAHYNYFDNQSFSELCNENPGSNQLMNKKDWMSSTVISDSWQVTNYLDMNYVFQLDYINFIKDSMQISKELMFNLFPREVLSIYGEVFNKNKSYYQFSTSELASTLIVDNITYAIMRDDFQAQNDYKTEVGLEINPGRNWNFKAGAFNLTSNNRIALLNRTNADSTDARLFNAGDIKLQGISLGLHYKFNSWLHSEFLYNILQGKGIIVKSFDDDYLTRTDNLPVTIYQLSARVLAQNSTTKTAVSLYYKYQRGTPVLIYEKIKNTPDKHLLNIEIKQKIPYVSDFNKCTIEFLILLQNILKQTDQMNSNADWESEMIDFIPKGIAGGLVFHF